jgi:hypothetical protein
MNPTTDNPQADDLPPNTCRRCKGPYELVVFAHDTKSAVWCPSCNLTWQPMDHQPPPRPEPEPEMDRSQIIWAREIKEGIIRRKAIRAELANLQREAIRDNIRQEAHQQ